MNQHSKYNIILKSNSFQILNFHTFLLPLQISTHQPVFPSHPQITIEIRYHILIDDITDILVALFSRA